MNSSAMGMSRALRPVAPRFEPLDQGTTIEHAGERICLGATFRFAQRATLLTQSVRHAERDENGGGGHGERQSGMQQEVCVARVAHQQANGGRDGERLEQSPRDQEEARSSSAPSARRGTRR